MIDWLRYRTKVRSDIKELREVVGWLLHSKDDESRSRAREILEKTKEYEDE